MTAAWFAAFRSDEKDFEGWSGQAAVLGGLLRAPVVESSGLAGWFRGCCEDEGCGWRRECSSPRADLLGGRLGHVHLGRWRD